MDAQKRFLRFKLAAVGTGLLGIGALAYSQGWIALSEANDPNKGVVKYVTGLGKPNPEQAAKSLVESLDRLGAAQVEGPYLSKTVGNVFEHSSVSKRHELLKGLEAYLVKDHEFLAEVSKRSIEREVLSEKDTGYLISRGFSNLESESQKDVLLELYRSSDPEIQVCLAEQGLADHPGGVAKKWMSDIYGEVRTSLRDAGDWTFDRKEEP
ncbi:MAG: hypothetical protein AABX70_02550 [Nanoarchaeota archaeon]